MFTGNARMRIFSIIIGYGLALGAILLAYIEDTIFYYIIPHAFYEFFDFFELLGKWILVITLSLSFIAIWRTPPFLELHWKNFLLKLYIINVEKFLSLYTYDFFKEIHKYDLEAAKQNDSNKELISRGIMGINEILVKITDADPDKIEKIEHGDSIIYIKHGSGNLSSIYYVLIVSQESSSCNFFLELVKRQFESLYRNIIKDFDSIENHIEEIFLGFDKILNSLLKKNTLLVKK